MVSGNDHGKVTPWFINHAPETSMDFSFRTGVPRDNAAGAPLSRLMRRMR